MHCRSTLLAVAAVAGTFAAPVQAQTDLFGQLVRKLSQPSTTRSSGASSAPRGAPATMIEPTAAQTEDIRRRLTEAGTTPAIRQDLAAAMRTLLPIVSTMACATDAVAYRRLNGRSIEPRNYTGGADTYSLTPIGRMQYHDRSTCVDLYRVLDVGKPALNELVLRLSFLSASSGETGAQAVSLRKTGDGWLLDAISQ